MLIVGSAFKGYAIEASDGSIGTVEDFLFDDATWKIRWLVVDTGHWLSTRKVLLHPASIGQADHSAQRLSVSLTRQQVEDSPEIAQDRPVTMQMQARLYDYYGADPYWGPNYFGMGAAAAFMAPLPRHAGADVMEADALRDEAAGDPHLRSMAAVTGYHIDATDGAIGHVESFLVDDATWGIGYLVVDTRNWWPGAHVLVSPFAVRDVDWAEHRLHLDITREQVKASPPWNPVEIIDRAYEQRLHNHYAWPGYGW